MRYLQRQLLDKKKIQTSNLAVSIGGDVIMDSPHSLRLPKGTTGQRSIIPENGMIRFNSTTGEVEVYQNSSWRALRFKESTGITQQTLGYGDGLTTIFGPLNPAPPSTVASGTTWGGQNLVVLVENVYQIHTTNYTIVQNPSIAGRTYNGDISVQANPGDSVLTFDVTTSPIYPSVNITGAAVTDPGSGLQASTVVSNYSVDSSGRLTSITLDKTVANIMTVGTIITITDSTNVGSGYYIQFNSAAPYSKAVTVLHGFDQ